MTKQNDSVAFSTTFRTRLQQRMQELGINQASLSRRAGVDRSTLSALLSQTSEQRLPRVATLAGIASALGTSLDWLLGLTNDNRDAMQMYNFTLEFSPTPNTPDDENLQRWFEESVGTKVRHVPTNLPDICKLKDTIAHEFRESLYHTTTEAISARQDLTDLIVKAPEQDTDVEICMSLQSLDNFTHGEHIWRGLSRHARRLQLKHLADLVDREYPRIRLYLFDERRYYASPYTIFGRRRAALYLGQFYVVMNEAEHVRAIIQHFDELVRNASVTAREAAVHVERQAHRLN